MWSLVSTVDLASQWESHCETDSLISVSIGSLWHSHLRYPFIIGMNSTVHFVIKETFYSQNLCFTLNRCKIDNFCTALKPYRSPYQTFSCWFEPIRYDSYDSQVFGREEPLVYRIKSVYLRSFCKWVARTLEKSEW